MLENCRDMCPKRGKLLSRGKPLPIARPGLRPEDLAPIAPKLALALDSTNRRRVVIFLAVALFCLFGREWRLGVPLLIAQPSPMAFEPPGREEPPFLGGSRGRAVSALSQGLRDREVLLLLTGPAGVGKTIVLDAAIATLADDSIRVIRLSNPGGLAWCPRDVARQIIGRSVDVSTDDTVSAGVAELTATGADKDQLGV